MPTATLTCKGRITVPFAVRAVLGLVAGQAIEFLPEGDGFRVVAVRTDGAVLRGRFAGRVKKPVGIADMGVAITAGVTGLM